MTKFFKIISSVFVDMLHEIKYILEGGIKYFTKLIRFILPYIMYYLGASFKISPYIIVAIPICVFIITYIMDSYANKIGKGMAVPVPDRRFTEVSDDGEVSISNTRIQEMILYLADLEDWMERKNLL